MSVSSATKPTHSAWIEPTGKIHYVNDCKHHEWALDNGYDGGDELQDIGWVHLSGGYPAYDIRPTQAQIDAMFDIAVALEQIASLASYASRIMRQLAKFEETR